MGKKDMSGKKKKKSMMVGLKTLSSSSLRLNSEQQKL